jgi:hypothetical protein
MKHLIAASVLTILALPAAAAPVELVCNGTLHWYGDSHGSSLVNGIHILVGDDAVQVSGTTLYAATYRITRENSDAAVIRFSFGLWAGSINRYSGELTLNKWSDTAEMKVDHSINATCGKADPLF